MAASGPTPLWRARLTTSSTPDFADHRAGGPNLTSTAAVLEGGAAEIAHDQLLTIIDAISQGADLVIFGAVFQSSPLAMLSLPDRPIRTPEDLIGRRIGVQQGGKALVDAILSVNGLPREWTEVPVGFSPDPLLEGDVDGYTGFVTNQGVTLTLQGVDHVAAPYADLGLPSYANGLYARREYLEEHRDTLAGYVGAAQRGWELNAEDASIAPLLTLDKYGRALGLDLEQQSAQNEAQIPFTQSSLTNERGSLWLSKELISGPMYEGFRAAGRADLPDVDSYVDLGILETASEHQRPADAATR